MRKKKGSPLRAAMVRLPQPTYDRLLRRASERQIAERRKVSVSSLIVEAVEQAVK